MPFQSAAQRRFMYSQHPEIAKRWSKKYGSKVIKRRIQNGKHGKRGRTS